MFASICSYQRAIKLTGFQKPGGSPWSEKKFMGYKTFYLLLSVITQSWPGQQTLIIIREDSFLYIPVMTSMTKWLEGGDLPPAHHVPDPVLHLSRSTAQRESKGNAGLSGGGSTAFGTGLADRQKPRTLPSQLVQTAQGIKIFHLFLVPATTATSSPPSAKAGQKDGAG